MIMRTSKARRLLLLGVIAAVQVPSIAAADVSGRLRAVGLPGAGTYGYGILKPDELEQCLKAEKEIQAASAMLKTTESALKRQSDEVEKLARELSGGASQLVRTSQAAVDSYNAKVQRFQTLVAPIKDEITAFNARTNSHNVRVQQFIGSCAEKDFYDSDRRALRARYGF
jgi:Skp family chaperone for outer membrane proteins